MVPIAKISTKDLTILILSRTLKDFFKIRVLIIMLLPLSAGITFYFFVRQPISELFFSKLLPVFTSNLSPDSWLQNIYNYLDPNSLFGFISQLLVFFIFLPMGLLLGLLVTSVIARPILQVILKKDHYPQSLSKGSLGFLFSLQLYIKTIFLYALALVISIILMFFPPLFLLWSFLVGTFLNYVFFSADAASGLLSDELFVRYRKNQRWQLWMLSALVTLTVYIPMGFLITPIFGTLIFLHSVFLFIEKQGVTP